MVLSMNIQPFKSIIAYDTFEKVNYYKAGVPFKIPGHYVRVNVYPQIWFEMVS